MTGSPATALRGRMLRDAPMAPLTWFRVGGPADRLYLPADAADLAAFLQSRPDSEPLRVVGVGSNLLVRDGGLRGVTLRLGRGFNQIDTGEGPVLRAGAAALAARVAEVAADAGLAGLEFMRGIPGTIGGALAMNAGCYGASTAAVLSAAEAMDRDGARVRLAPEAMGFAYRSCAAASGRIFLAAEFRLRPDRPEAVRARMQALMRRRAGSQPVRSRTGGSTFRNPGGRPGAGADPERWRESAWRLIDAAGCRGLARGDAAVSEQHANFLVNRGRASAADLESLAEDIRARVQAHSGVRLTWEIHRIGEAATDG